MPDLSTTRYLEAARQQLALWEFLGRRKADEIVAIQTYSIQHPNTPLVTEVVMPAIQGTRLAQAHEHNALIRPYLIRAQPIYWSSEMAALAHRAAQSFPLDRPFRPSDLPVPSGFVWFEDPQELPPLTGMVATDLYTSAPKADWLRGFFWFSFDDLDGGGEWQVSRGGEIEKLHGQGVYVGFIVEDPDTRVGGILQGMLPLIYGHTIGGFVNMSRNTRILASQARTAAKFQHAFAATLLMQQTVIRSSRHRVDRPTSRAWDRARQVAPEVEVVYLRRSRSVQRDEGESNPVDWSCRWWVGTNDGGFWRTYHRGTPDEFTRWIFPFVKGPADKPLKAPSSKLFAVVR